MQAQLLNWYRTGGLRASRLWAEPSSVDHTASIAFPVQCAALQSPRGIFQDCNCVWLQTYMQFSLVKNMHFHLAINMHFPIPMPVHKLPTFSINVEDETLANFLAGKLLMLLRPKLSPNWNSKVSRFWRPKLSPIWKLGSSSNCLSFACRTEHAQDNDNYGSRMTYCCMRPIPQVRPPMSHVVCGQYLGRL